MSFCPNCGNQIADGSKFCPACGTSLGGGAASIGNFDAPVGMRTVEEVQSFYKNTLQMQEKYVRKYTPGITTLVSSLTPGEGIEFATHCVIGGLQNGTMAEIATTNRRFIVANTLTGTTIMNDALNHRRRNSIESYRYDTFSGITFQSGLLTGSVDIGFIDGTITVCVDKKWTQIVYKGLSASFYNHSGGSF